MKFVKKYWPTLLVTVVMLILIGIVISYNKATAEGKTSTPTAQHYKERCLWKLIELENAKIEVTVPPMECSAMTEDERLELTGAIGTYIRNIVLP